MQNSNRKGENKKHWYQVPVRDELDYDIILDDESYMAKCNLRCSEVGADYSWLNGPDSVKEVGSIHTCRSLDMNYCGVIIGKDLRYKDGQLIYCKNQIAKKDRASGIRTADEETAEKLIRIYILCAAYQGYAGDICLL